MTNISRIETRRALQEWVVCLSEEKKSIMNFLTIAYFASSSETRKCHIGIDLGADAASIKAVVFV